MDGAALRLIGLELALLACLGPHLTRAIQLRHRLEAVETQRNSAQAALERLSTAVILVDGKGTVLFANQRAQAMQSGPSGLRVRGGVIHAAQPGESAGLRRLIGEAAQAAAGVGLSAGGVAVRLQASSATALDVLVTPIKTELIELGFAAPPACVALFVTVAGLAEGASVEELAARFGISVHTARTQLKAVLRKTGTRRQAQLTACLLSGPAATANQPPANEEAMLPETAA